MFYSVFFTNQKHKHILSICTIQKPTLYTRVRCYTLSLAYEGMCRHATAILFSLAFEGTNISFPCALYKNLKLHKHIHIHKHINFKKNQNQNL